MSKVDIIKEWVKVESSKDKAAVDAIIKNEPLNGYVGWVGYGNLGDEGVYEALRSLFPEKNFTAFRSAKPMRLISAVYGRKLPLASLALGGGTLINQSPVWYDEVSEAIRNNVPTFCIGTGVASSKSADSPPDAKDDLMAKWVSILPKFIYAGVRGPMAQEYLQKAGFSAEIVGDTALALAQPTYTRRRMGKKIGVNISYGTDGIMHGNPNKFLDEIRTAISQLCNEGYEVVIFPIWKGDLDASQQLIKNIDSPNVRIEKAYKSVATYLEAINTCDIFVGQKLHATIFSTLMRIPSIMLEYRPKCLDYMKSINMEEFSIRTDDLNTPQLLATISNIQQDYNNIVKRLDDSVLYYKNLQQIRAREISRQLS